MISLTRRHLHPPEYTSARHHNSGGRNDHSSRSNQRIPPILDPLFEHKQALWLLRKAVDPVKGHGPLRCHTCLWLQRSLAESALELGLDGLRKPVAQLLLNSRNTFASPKHHHIPVRPDSISKSVKINSSICCTTMPL